VPEFGHLMKHPRIGMTSWDGGTDRYGPVGTKVGVNATTAAEWPSDPRLQIAISLDVGQEYLPTLAAKLAFGPI